MANSWSALGEGSSRLVTLEGRLGSSAGRTDTMELCRCSGSPMGEVMVVVLSVVQIERAFSRPECLAHGNGGFIETR